MSEHPFIVGSEVAIRMSGYGFNSPNYYRLSRVTKVLPSGKFRIDGSDAQWLAFPPRDNWHSSWYAVARGAHSGELVILDDSTRAMVDEKNATYRRYKRYSDVRHLLSKEPFSERVTEEVLQALEMALREIKPPQQVSDHQGGVST